MNRCSVLNLACSTAYARRCRCDECRAWKAGVYAKDRVADNERSARYRAANAERTKDYHARYQAENRDRRRANAVEWKRRNPERIRLLNAAYRERNRERLREKAAEYRAQNGDKRREYSAGYNPKWREANPDYHREYLQANLDKHRASQARRRARKLGRLPDDRVEEVRAFERVLRGAQDYYRAQGIEVEVDHIIPLARGGAHVPENLRLVSASDNRRKHDRLDEEMGFEIVEYPVVIEGEVAA